MMRRAAEPASLDETLMALADPTRREILRRLSRGDARVTDVAAPFAISLNSVSKHIVMLERAGTRAPASPRARAHPVARSGAD